MKHLKIYEKFEEANKIVKFCREYNIKEYKINEDGSIDVFETVDLNHNKGSYISLGNHNKLKKIPIKFNRILIKNVEEFKYFSCSNIDLITLENCPNYVSGSFECEQNPNLETLLGGPSFVSGGYWCRNCNLKDMYGFPENYFGKIHCSNNPVDYIISIVNENKRLNFIKLLNEYLVIRNQDTIIESRLIDALSELGIEKLSGEFDDYFKNIKRMARNGMMRGKLVYNFEGYNLI